MPRRALYVTLGCKGGGLFMPKRALDVKFGDLDEQYSGRLGR